uniref:SHSP domain-containing protein n=1 Tax=Ditylenchus dipsaci TaxID=166011 RepID=A0A915EPU9_9BILA
MSLIPFEDLFTPSRRPVYYHQRYTPDLMTSLLNDSFGQLQQLERQLGQAVQEDGNNYNFKCSVAGYRPEELSVDVQGEQLVIQGKHQQQDNDQSIHRTFERRLTLPPVWTNSLSSAIWMSRVVSRCRQSRRGLTSSRLKSTSRLASRLLQTNSSN